MFVNLYPSSSANLLILFPPEGVLFYAFPK